MCTQYSLLKYIKPPPNKSEGKMYNSYVHNATQSQQNSQCCIRSCPPFQNNDILPWFLSPSFFYGTVSRALHTSLMISGYQAKL